MPEDRVQPTRDRSIRRAACSACSANRVSMFWRSIWRWTGPIEVRPASPMPTSDDYIALMADRDDPEQRPSPEALLEAAAAGRSSRRPAEDFRRRRARRRQDLRDAAECACADEGDGVDVVVGVVETHGRAEPKRCSKVLKCPAQADRIQEPVARGNGPRRASSRGIRKSRWSTNSPTPMRPAAVIPSAISMSRNCSPRHRRLYRRQHPAHRKPQRRRRADHPCSRARDRAGLVLRSRRRHRAGRSDARRSDPAAEGRQGLRPRAGRTRARAFFSPANLTALRELALRRTAERVDEQLLTHMQAHAIAGPWAAGERILVCISEDPRAAGLVRYAKRLADRLHAPWTALYIETPAQPAAHRGAARPDRRHAAAGRSAGRRSGDHPRRRPPHRRRRHRLFAQANNITQIIIGKSTRSRWFEILHGSVVHDLVRRRGNISVHVDRRRCDAGRRLPRTAVRPPTRPSRSIRGPI